MVDCLSKTAHSEDVPSTDDCIVLGGGQRLRVSSILRVFYVIQQITTQMLRPMENELPLLAPEAVEYKWFHILHPTSLDFIHGSDRPRGSLQVLLRNLQDLEDKISNVSILKSAIISNWQLLIDTDEQKRRWRENPLEYQKYCKEMENELNQRFKFILNGSPEAEEALKVWWTLLCFNHESTDESLSFLSNQWKANSEAVRKSRRS